MAFSHRILVLGATGPTGREVVAQALDGGHRVTAVARRPHRLALEHPRLTKVSADLAAESAAIPGLLREHDVVISTLGRGRSLRSEGLMARVAPALVSAMEQQGVERLLFVSAFGVGGIAPSASLVFRFMFRFMLQDIYADKATARHVFAGARCSGPSWLR
jgi:putative NADH-flavin reductase